MTTPLAPEATRAARAAKLAMPRIRRRSRARAMSDRGEAIAPGRRYSCLHADAGLMRAGAMSSDEAEHLFEVLWRQPPPLPPPAFIGRFPASFVITSSILAAPLFLMTLKRRLRCGVYFRQTRGVSAPRMLSFSIYAYRCLTAGDGHFRLLGVF